MKQIIFLSLLLTIFIQSINGQERYQHLYAIIGIEYPTEGFAFNTNLDDRILMNSLGAGSSYQFGRFQIGTEFYNANGDISNERFKIEYKKFSSTLILGYDLLESENWAINPILGLSRSQSQVNLHHKQAFLSFQYNSIRYGLSPALRLTKYNPNGQFWGMKLGYNYALSPPNWQNGIDNELSPYRESGNSFFLQLTFGGRINLKKTKETMLEHSFSPLQASGNKTMQTVAIPNGETTLQTTIYPNNKETVILLHGGPGVPDNLLPIVNALKNDYQVVTFLQRGVGQSKCKNGDYSMDAYISDIDAIAAFLELDSFHLFGHSWGGLYAQIFSERRPEKVQSLLLCSPSAGTGKDWTQTQKEVMKFNKAMSSKKEWLAMGWNSMIGLLGSDKAYQKLFAQVLKNYHKEYEKVDFSAEYFSQIHAKPINRTIKNIKKYPTLKGFRESIPVLITFGQNDIYGDSQAKSLARFPSAQQIIIPNSGHIPWVHNPNYFQQVLTKFYHL